MKFDTVRLINSYFRLADKGKIDKLMEKVVFSERQQVIFDMYYIKRKNCGFIADSLCVCPGVITKELHAMREKILMAI